MRPSVKGSRATQKSPKLDGEAQKTYRAFVVSALSQVSASEWDALLEPDDAPLLSWAYLEGLEAAGCVGPGTTWQPAHLLIRQLPDEQLVAAAPAYVKFDSDGEWVHDFDWAAFAETKDLAYYPKLAFTVPFNPVGGGRLLARPDLPEEVRAELMRFLLVAAKELCKATEMSSVHVLFPRPSEPALSALSQAGFLRRQQEQYHFLNRLPDGSRPYRDFEDFLSQMRSHRRTAIRRERKDLKAANITVKTLRGLGTGFTLAELDAMFDFYQSTSLRYTGERPYLNRRFFHLCAERLGDRLELVLAYRRDSEKGEESLVAGAFNLRGDRRLFGRHWGLRSAGEEPAQELPFLHFEVCYYHSVERCISEGLDAFEPGHGGEHKLSRGFTPVLTESAHFLRDLKLRRPIAAFLAAEAPLVLASLASATARCPLRLSAKPAAIDVLKSPVSPRDRD